jgi:hypothetical protein
MDEPAYIEYDNTIKRYHLYSPINKNNRIYLHSVKETLDEVLIIGLEHFKEVKYEGVIYTERILKLKKIWKRLTSLNL